MKTTVAAMQTFTDIWPVLRILVIGLMITAVIVLTPWAYNELARMKHDRKIEKLKIMADDDNFFTDLLAEAKADVTNFFNEDIWVRAIIKAYKYNARHKHSKTEKTYYTPGYLGTEV